MSFFNMFYPNKEGAGVSKNEPVKPPYKRFFINFFSYFWKYIPVNIVYSLLSSLFVTGGLSAVGLTRITRDIAQERPSFWFSDFFESLRANLKPAIKMGFINALVWVFLILDGYFFSNIGGIIGTVGLGLIVLFAVIFSMMNYYIWTLLITVDFSVRNIYGTAFRLCIINLKNSIFCFLINFAFVLIFVLSLYLSGVNFLVIGLIELLLSWILLPSFKYLLIQYFVFPAIRDNIIAPYYKEHPDEDLEKRNDLGID